MGRLVITGCAALAGICLTGCNKLKHDKEPAEAAKPANPVIVIATTNAIHTNLLSVSLGTIQMTNHHETRVPVGNGTNCCVTPEILDPKNLQLLVVVEARNARGQMEDLAISKVVTKPGEPLEAEVGGFSFSFTPNVVEEVRKAGAK